MVGFMSSIQLLCSLQGDSMSKQGEKGQCQKVPFL